MKTNVDDSRSCSSSTGDVFIGDCIDKNSNEFMSTNTSVGKEIWLKAKCTKLGNWKPKELQKTQCPLLDQLEI